MVSEDEYLERIVAGIHAITSASAVVSWNESINGRQFDVVVRFDLGTLHYLVLIEVKNRTRRATASDVEAFVTKARDQNANKSVFVTIAGFQQGALAVARRHGVDLFTIAFDKKEIGLSQQTTRVILTNGLVIRSNSAKIQLSEPQFVRVIEGAKLRYRSGQVFEMPIEQSQMRYYAAKTKMADGRSLMQLIENLVTTIPELGKVMHQEISLPLSLHIVPPDEYFFPSGMLRKIDLTIAGREGRTFSGDVFIEPTSFHSPVIYTNVLTQEVTRYPLDQLPLNIQDIVVGRFYFQIHPLRYFHCANIANQLITWNLIESFQGETLIRATYTQQAQYGRYYIPVADKKIQARLEHRLNDLRNLPQHKEGAAASGRR